MDPQTEEQKDNQSSDMIHEELQKLKQDNGMLNRRLLGVNELARLLQEKSETCDNLTEKNKRLEIAVVRLENRCSNFDKKMKAQQFSSLPSGSGPNSKSSHNSPFIPGPSKQILESLMKENHELKKTINNFTKKGPVGYREAVKMNQLEEVIDQKNEKIELLLKQIDTLTAPHSENEGASVMVDPGLLKRQLLKMEQSMKVKDRFCTLLSERVNQLQKELNETKDNGEDSIDGVNETVKPKTTEEYRQQSTSDPTQLRKEFEVKERNSRKMIDELQSQVENERNEKKEIISKAEESTRKVSSLETEITSLQQQLESFGAYNDTLVKEKMDLSSDVMKLNEQLQKFTTTGYKDIEGKVSELERNFKREVQAKDQEIDRLKGLLEDVRYKFTMSESEKFSFSNQQDTSAKMTQLEEKIKDLEEDKLHLGGQIERHLWRIQELTHTVMKLKNSGGSSMSVGHAMRTGGASPIIPHNTKWGQEVTVDHARIKHSPEPQSGPHCGPNLAQYYHRPEVPPLHSRSVELDGGTESSSPVTTPTNTQSPSKPRQLDIGGESVQQQQQHQQRINYGRGNSLTPHNTSTPLTPYPNSSYMYASVPPGNSSYSGPVDYQTHMHPGLVRSYTNPFPTPQPVVPTQQKLSDSFGGTGLSINRTNSPSYMSAQQYSTHPNFPPTTSTGHQTYAGVPVFGNSSNYPNPVFQVSPNQYTNPSNLPPVFGAGSSSALLYPNSVVYSQPNTTYNPHSSTGEFVTPRYNPANYNNNPQPQRRPSPPMSQPLQQQQQMQQQQKQQQYDPRYQ